MSKCVYEDMVLLNIYVFRVKDCETKVEQFIVKQK